MKEGQPADQTVRRAGGGRGQSRGRGRGRGRGKSAGGSGRSKGRGKRTASMVSGSSEDCSDVDQCC